MPYLRRFGPLLPQRLAIYRLLASLGGGTSFLFTHQIPSHILLLEVAMLWVSTWQQSEIQQPFDVPSVSCLLVRY